MYNFTVAKMENFDDFYKIKSEPNSVYWSGFAKAPDYESFKEHYKKELSRKDRTIILLYTPLSTYFSKVLVYLVFKISVKTIRILNSIKIKSLR